MRRTRVGGGIIKIANHMTQHWWQLRRRAGKSEDGLFPSVKKMYATLAMTNRTRFAAIFDWDGVIVDSAAAHETSWNRLAAEKGGLPLPLGHFKIGFGRRNEFIIPEILGWSRDPVEIARLADRKEEIYREIVRDTLREPLPGARELLEDLRRAGIPCAIGSSTHRANIEFALDRLNLRGYFAGIVTGEDVKRGKPAPDVFLQAAASVGCAPGRGVVFEDAIAGIEAGLAGGFAVIAVATTQTPEALVVARPTHIIRSLKEVNAMGVSATLGWFDVMKECGKHAVVAG